MNIWGIGRFKASMGSLLLRLPMKRVVKHPDFAFKNGEKVRVSLAKNGNRIIIDKIE